ncbi:MAG: PqiC family protein [Porticoccaceae bacterium]|jgi:uncharacterized lipoprotein YmbA|nr:PqiC family protein [Porticoccaceae bacterium]MEA3300760.1 PqiC family protein [Pseudomonadota bacterium]HLS98624.1 PqiC family protein [Porticoccaceae bacterium]
MGLPRRPFPLAALLCLALATGGCLAPRSPAPDYYLLIARSESGQPTLAGKTLGIGPVRVAPFLDRPQIVTHGADGSLTLAEGHRWAEPLDRGIQRVMEQNLSALTGATTRNFPWTRATIPDFALRLDVLELNRDGGDAVLEASWVIEDLAASRVLAGGRERLIQPIDDPAATPGSLAVAYSALLDSLARTLALALDRSAGPGEKP